MIKKVFYFVIIIFLISCKQYNNTQTQPKIEKGIIDLSKWDFNTQGPVNLTGESDFFWNKFLSEEPLKSITVKDYMNIPSTWNGFTLHDGTKLPIYGFCSYRIKVLLPDTKDDFSLFFRDAGTAYKIYIFKNNSYSLIGKGGIPAKTKDQSISLFSSSKVDLPRQNEIYLLFEVSNFDNFIGGLWNSPVLGLKKHIIVDRENEKMKTFFVIGCLFIIAIYNFVLFILRREDKAPLLLGIVCLFIALRSYLTGRYFEERNPQLYIFQILYSLDYLTMFISFPILIGFLSTAFKNLFHKIFTYFYYITFSLLTLLTIFTSSSIFSKLTIVNMLLILIGIIWMITMLTKASFWQKNKHALMSLGGILFLAVTAINDILYTTQMIISGFFLQYGMVAFISMQAFVVAMQNSTARRKIEVLSIDLKKLNENLEIKVDERTIELKAALGELEAINEQLIMTRDELWGEMEIAKKIQTTLLPANPTITNYEIVAFMEPADLVGGDYYDIINTEEMDWIIIGDVSGHGVPAGLIMMMVQTSIHTVLTQFPSVTPSKMIELLNEVIFGNIQKMNEDKYMTLTVLACVKDGTFHFSGLHQNLIIYRHDSKKVESIETDGMWIGLFDNLDGVINTNTVKLNVNDSMLLYTDGITEAWKKGSVPNQRDPKIDMFGNDKLEEILEEYGGQNPQDVVDALMKELDQFECYDDVTLVTIKRLK